MKIENIGTVIAERQLDGEENGEPCKVIVRLGKPFLAENDGGSCWYCPYSIMSNTGERLFYGAGFDSVQALRHAILMVGAELTSLYSDLKLRFDGEDDLGFSSRT